MGKSAGSKGYFLNKFFQNRHFLNLLAKVVHEKAAGTHNLNDYIKNLHRTSFLTSKGQPMTKKWGHQGPKLEKKQTTGHSQIQMFGIFIPTFDENSHFLGAGARYFGLVRRSHFLSSQTLLSNHN